MRPTPHTAALPAAPHAQPRSRSHTRKIRTRTRTRTRTHGSCCPPAPAPRPPPPTHPHPHPHTHTPLARRRLGQTREELAECVEQLNAQRQAEAGGQEATRLAQLVEVMDVHVNALHYLESQSDKLDATLQQVALLGGQQAMQRAWLHENPQQQQ